MMSWNLQRFFVLCILAALGILSLFHPTTKTLWEPIDQGFFRIVNGWISKTPFWQHFWAMANHRLTDFLIEDLGFVLFFIWILYATPAKERLYKGAECLFILLYGAFIILIANELLFRNLLHIQRASPTLVMEECTRLSTHVTWLKIKTESLKSFPGDHATTALFSILGFLYLTRGKGVIAWVTCGFGLFLALPRLVVGAHWLTDVLIGSGSILILSWALAFCTPLHRYVIDVLYKTLQKLFPKKATL